MDVDRSDNDSIIEIECTKIDESTQNEIKDMNKHLKYNEDDEYLINEIECEILYNKVYFARLKRSYCMLANKQQIEKGPSTLKEALSGNNAAKWKRAIANELNSLEKKGTWRLIYRSEVPRNKPIIDSHWVLKLKLLPDNSFIEKAKLVLKGFKLL